MDPPTPTKLRLLCSFNGRIVPRPHDKTLCYAGGETRLLAVDRRSSFASLSSHISRSLLNNRPFFLKYQLPDHDLDSLVSLASNEDLSNMFDEYDRASLSSSPSRLRFFLFPASSSSSSSPSDYDPRSEAWFFDALRSAGITVDGKRRSSESGSGGEGAVVDSSAVCGDSVFLETSSSLGSSTRSATSVAANLPAIKVGGGGVDEVGGGALGHGLKVNQSLVDSLESDSSTTSPNFQSPTLVYMDSLSQSDPKDSKLFTNSMETDITSPDISPRLDQLNPMQAYAYSLSQPMDQMQQQPSTPQTPSQAQLQPQFQPTLQAYSQLPPQYIHASPQYISQYYSGGLPTASYPTAYQPYLQQQQQQQAAYQLNKSYPVYLMHVGQPQAHDIAVQCDMTTAGSISPSHPQLLSNPPMMVTSPVVYDGYGTPKASDIAAKVYRPGPTASQAVSIQSEEHQPKILAVAQMNQPQPVSSVADGASYGGTVEFEDSLHAQIYKTQPTVPANPIASQRQPATSAATAMLLDNLTQLQLDSAK